MPDFAQRLHERGPQFRDLNAKIKELQWVDSQFRQAGIEKDRLSKVVTRRQAELEGLKKITYVFVLFHAKQKLSTNMTSKTERV
jgi:hypothetical protein